jgi:radical SAM protein with 4Fe4S-binding SPASM domain
MCPNAREDWTEENLEILHQEVHKIFTDFILHFMEGQWPINCALIDNAFKKVLEHDLQVRDGEFADRVIVRPAVRCGLGSGSLSIAYDGKLFGCQEQDSRDTSDYFYIGNIYDGVDVEKHKRILEDYTQPAAMTSQDPKLCETCIVRHACFHDVCPSVSHDRFNTFFTRPTVDCLYQQWMMEDAIIAMDILVNQENNQMFRQYLDDIFQNYEIITPNGEKGAS